MLNQYVTIQRRSLALVFRAEEAPLHPVARQRHENILSSTVRMPIKIPQKQHLTEAYDFSDHTK